MVKWLRNKHCFLVGTLVLLCTGTLSAQQTAARTWELDPLAAEAVLLPEPLPVPVLVVPLGIPEIPGNPENTVTPGNSAIPARLGDKKELDEEMTAKIAYGSIDPIRPVDPRSLVLHRIDSTGILRTEGDIFWIETLSSDLYFTTADDTLQILWSKEHPAQSISNLLLGQIDKPDFGIDLTHRRYGNDKPRFHVSWASLYNTLCSEGVRQYASGFVRDGGTSLRGILIVHHPNGNYVHMLILTTTIEELFAPDGQRKDLRGDLFTNVPQQNILNLYE